LGNRSPGSEGWCAAQFWLGQTARDSADLPAALERYTGRTGDAAAHLREAAQIALQTGTWRTVLNVLYFCGYLCAATGRSADAITAWAIDETLGRHGGFAWRDVERRRREGGLREARRALGPDRARAAEERGAAMSLATAAEQVLVAERHAALRQALVHLPSCCQRLLVLLIEDPPIPYAEISATLGIPVGSIGPTRLRCLDKLRRQSVIAALIDAETQTA
jgi:hypothetical protein